MSLLRSNLQVELVAAFSEAKKETRELRLTQQARLILDAHDVEGHLKRVIRTWLKERIFQVKMKMASGVIKNFLLIP